MGGAGGTEYRPVSAWSTSLTETYLVLSSEFAMTRPGRKFGVYYLQTTQIFLNLRCMFRLKNKDAVFPPLYDHVERKLPTAKDKGWDKVGNFTLRDKKDFIPQPGLQEN